MGSVAGCLRAQDEENPGATGSSGNVGVNLMADANAFENTPLVDNPWGGVINGVLQVLPGRQSSVNDAGQVVPTIFSPSVQIGDLNGDGLPDIVAADAKGYFWFFPNSGTPTQAKFTYGEVMPIWIGDPWMPEQNNEYSKYGVDFDKNDNTVPRIQLIDYGNEGKLSILAGNYAGKLFFIHNVGTRTQPAFAMPKNLDSIVMPTYSQGKLWCNFLAPYLYDFTGTGRLDLILGEGTYASNSIYLLTNKGSSQSPTFNEMNTVKIIPGVGREHLTPQVIDWNHDGKPDLIMGERLGFIDLFLNTTTDPGHLTFDLGQHVKFGASEVVGPFASVAVGDLNANKLPNLVVSSSDDRIMYAENKGALGAPVYAAPVPLRGTNIFPKMYDAPTNWFVYKALGIAYTSLCCVNKSTESDFVPPEPNLKSALKIYTMDNKNVHFPTPFYPDEDTHVLQFRRGITISSHTHYKLSFWIKTVNEISDLTYVFDGREYNNGDLIRAVEMSGKVDSPTTWTHYTTTFTSFDSSIPDKRDEDISFRFFLGYGGKGAIYLDDFNLTKDAN